MKSKTFQTYRFSAINIKKEVADRFREFSKSLGDTHTESLEAMLRFFSVNSLSPYESLGDNMETLERRLKKRINALIAIIKDIEKRQTKPTQAMLQLLFEQAGEPEGQMPLLQEKEIYGGEVPGNEWEEPAAKEGKGTPVQRQHKMEQLYGEECERSKKLYGICTEIKAAVHYVKPGFGKNHYRLEMNPEQWEKLNKYLENVYHHHPPKTGK